MPRKHSDRRVIRWALEYAILDRKSYLDAIAHCDWMAAERAETREKIEAMKAMLRRRYNDLPADERIDDTLKARPLRDVVKGTFGS